MAKSIEIKIYKPSELDRDRLCDKYRCINTDYHNWWEVVVEDFKKEMEKEHFFKVDDVTFELWGNNYGAWFEGSPAKMNEFLDSFEFDSSLLSEEIFDTITIDTSTTSGTYHKTSMSTNYIIDLDTNKEAEKILYKYVDFLIKDIMPSIKDFLNGEAKQLYTDLLEKYEQLTSNDAIIETLEANEYEFTEDYETYIEEIRQV